MEVSGDNDSHRGSPGSGSNNLTRYGMQLSASNIIQAPVSALFEYLRTRSGNQESGSLIGRSYQNLTRATVEDSGNDGEVTIRIIGAGEAEHDSSPRHHAREGQNEVAAAQRMTLPTGMLATGGSQLHNESTSPMAGDSPRSESPEGVGATNSRDSSYQRYDMLQAARWIEHILPFTLLLLLVFIRQHLQGCFVTIWIALVMFKSNDILRKQTALKGERKFSILIGYSAVFALHVVAIYWWYRNDNLLCPLLMLPPKVIPPFWNAIFIIVVNDILVRQAAMIIKSMLLIYYKNSKGRNYRRQGQLLTMVEYMLLLYRGLLPAPVWYRFFLNKEYGSLFSSLITGLYLTIKLTTIIEKVQNFVASLKSISQKEIQYGAYATLEQVNVAGDLCAICQEKMHAPIFLRCKHLFCEDCVSEWFERERTCPLCRALVKPADLKSFGDGSTSLFFQLC